MTKAEYLQRGESLDYTNTGEDVIPDGAVVAVGSRIGIAGCLIPPGKTGSLHMIGVFQIAKTGTAAVEMGQTVYFDGTGITDAANNGAESSPTAYIEAGYAAAPADAGGESILVKLRG